MVSVYTKGRYGNSTWQQMAAYVYAKKHGLEYSAPKQSLAENVWPSYHKHLCRKDWDDNLDIVEVNDGQHPYTELPFDESWRDKNIILGTKSVETGYFQSWKYLTGHESELGDKFRLYDRPNEGIVSVHWRRGDFLSLPDKHPVVSGQYILDAMRLMEQKLSEPMRFQFFSDDIFFCKNFIEQNVHFNFQNKICFCYENDPEKSFHLMMNNEHQIVSNSSFSVLAGILNPNPNKIIIRPNFFFGSGNGHLDTRDVYPENWITI